MGAVAVGGQLLSGAISFFGNKKVGKQEERYYNQLTEQSLQNAQKSYEYGIEKAKRYADKYAYELGQLKDSFESFKGGLNVALSKSGISSSVTAEDILESNNMAYLKDKMTLARTSNINITDLINEGIENKNYYLQEAYNYKMYGKLAKEQRDIQSWAGLFSGIAGAGSTLLSMRRR